MDIAEAYLSELISRCLVQVPLLNINGIGKYHRCQLRDAVRELCLSKGKKKGFNFHVMNYRGGEFSRQLKESLSGTKTCHLAIHLEGQTASNPYRFTVHREDIRKHVRSLEFLNKRDSEKIEFQHNTLDLEKFKLLRVLVYVKFRFKGRQLREIGNLIHLRHLALRHCELDELSSSTSNLIYLHTLDLNFSWIVRVPNVLKEMHRLKHLILPFYKDSCVARNYKSTLEGLDELETLANFNSLVHDWKSVMRMNNLNTIIAEVYDNESLLAVINAFITKFLVATLSQQSKV